MGSSSAASWRASGENKCSTTIKSGRGKCASLGPNFQKGMITAAFSGCVAAPKLDPSSNRARTIEIAYKDASLVGSRSAPIGTPPSLAFSTLHQSARRDFVRGPARVLKHTRKHVGGGAGLPATPNRPRFALIRWLSGECRFNVNQRFAADLMDRY